MSIRRTKEAVNLIWKDGTPTAAIVQNNEVRTPQVYLLKEAAADEIADIFGAVDNGNAEGVRSSV